MPSNKHPEQILQLSVPVAMMERLMQDGHLCAADVRCLNAESKSRLRRPCLEVCTRQTRQRIAPARAGARSLRLQSLPPRFAAARLDSA